MESGYGNIAHGAWHLRQLLQSAQEQAFPGCKIGQIPVWTSWPGGRGAFSSSIAFLCAASKKISPAEAADKLSAYLKCVEERKAGNAEFRSAEEQTYAALRDNPLPALDYFMDRFLPGFQLTLDELQRCGEELIGQTQMDLTSGKDGQAQ